MKSKFLENGFSGTFLFSFVIFVLCSCSIINAVKYKSMFLAIKSKTYLNSREKMNKMLEKYKNEITKLKEINNKLSHLSGSLIIPKIIKRENLIKETKGKIVFNHNIKSDNNTTYLKNGWTTSNKTNYTYDQNGLPIKQFKLNDTLSQSEFGLKVKNKSNNNEHFTANLSISVLKNELLSEFFSENSISSEINLLNEVFIEKFNLTTTNFDWIKNKIKLPEFPKHNICFVDLSKNNSHNIYNQKYKEAHRKAQKLKEAKAEIEKEHNSFSAIDEQHNPFTKDLKVNERLRGLQKRNLNTNKLKNNFDRDVLKYSFLKIQEIIENIIPHTNNKNKSIDNLRISEATKEIPMQEKDSNKTLTKNSTQTEAQRLVFLSYPEPGELDRIINFFKLIHRDYKKDICNTCFNHNEFLQNLKIKISSAIQEIKDILLKPINKSELVEYFTDKINNVNLVKFNLENLRDVIKLQREFECEDFETINEYYEGSIKAANSLVEAIQNSIRKHNLNISFLIIS